MGTTAEEGYGVSLGRPVGTTAEEGYGVSPRRPVGTTAEEGYGVSPGNLRPHKNLPNYLQKHWYPCRFPMGNLHGYHSFVVITLHTHARLSFNMRHTVA